MLLVNENECIDDQSTARSKDEHIDDQPTSNRLYRPERPDGPEVDDPQEPKRETSVQTRSVNLVQTRPGVDFLVPEGPPRKDVKLRNEYSTNDYRVTDVVKVSTCIPVPRFFTSDGQFVRSSLRTPFSTMPTDFSTPVPKLDCAYGGVGIYVMRTPTSLEYS